MSSRFKISREKPQHLAVLSIAAFSLLYWFRIYFTGENIASVDLPSFIQTARALHQQLIHGNLVFYDKNAFAGWVVFRFYGFLPALFAALFPVSPHLGTPEALTLRTHLLLLTVIATLPCSFYYALWQLNRSEAAKQDRNKLVCALLAVAFSFWFLNHDGQSHGIGAAALLNIGLVGQGFGWHGLLLTVGLTARLWRNSEETPFPRVSVPLAACHAASLLSHTLTFAYTSAFSIFAIVFFGRARRSLALSYLLGLGLAAFWLLPTLEWIGTYTAYDVIAPKGDFLSVYFRYPLSAMLRSIPAWLHGDFSNLQPMNFFSPLLLLGFFCLQSIQDSRLFGGLALFLLLSVIVFSSGFVAASLPLALHYYRFFTPEFLLLSLLLASVPLQLLATSKHPRLISGLTIFCCALSIVFTGLLPHGERANIQRLVGRDYLSNEQQIVDFFSRQPTPGRVYLEHFNDYSRFPKLSTHYIASELAMRTAFEPIANSHLQESLGYRMITAAARKLGARTYNVPLLFNRQADWVEADALNMLREFGISHLVCGREQFCSSLKKLLGRPQFSAGYYEVFEIAAPNQLAVLPVKKALVGYLDLKHNLPFHFLQYAVASRQAAWRKVELLELNSLEDLPPQISTLVVNASAAKLEQLKLKLPHQRPALELIALDFQSGFKLEHYRLHYSQNVEQEKFREASRYLLRVLHLDRMLGALPEQTGTASPGKLLFAKDSQSFTASGLTAGQAYLVNYSYFPYWSSAEAALLRASGERMLLIPKAATAQADFSAWRGATGLTSWLGLLISVLCLLGSVQISRMN